VLKERLSRIQLGGIAAVVVGVVVLSVAGTA
jgi:drug/metabolite transporter (DMT)-like permease